ncbi:Trypsin [compost metagenome]
MNKYFSVLLVSMCIQSTAFAVVGSDSYVKVGGPDFACFITERDVNGTLTSICSGALVSPNKVLTAAHCMGRPESSQLYVQCGYSGVDQDQVVLEKTKKGTVVYTSGVKFKESSRATVLYTDTQNDQGVLVLEKNLSITPAQYEMDVFRRGQPPHLCSVLGFGRYNDATAGILHTGRLSQMTPVTDGESLVANIGHISEYVVDIREYQDDSYLKNGGSYSEKRIQVETANSAFIRSGDSGGPIICSDRGNYRIVGVGTNIIANPSEIPPSIEEIQSKTRRLEIISIYRTLHEETIEALKSK